jgi:hypothetical protein
MGWAFEARPNPQPINGLYDAILSQAWLKASSIERVVLASDYQVSALEQMNGPKPRAHSLTRSGLWVGPSKPDPTPSPLMGALWAWAGGWVGLRRPNP